MTKSHVAVEQQVCLVCAQKFDTGSILLDRRLRNRFEGMTALTGWGLCPEHEKLFDDGFIAVVGVDIAKSSDMTANGVWRTGEIAHIKEAAFADMLNVATRNAKGQMLPVAWGEPALMKIIEEMSGGQSASSSDGENGTGPADPAG